MIGSLLFVAYFINIIPHSLEKDFWHDEINGIYQNYEQNFTQIIFEVLIKPNLYKKPNSKIEKSWLKKQNFDVNRLEL